MAADKAAEMRYRESLIHTRLKWLDEQLGARYRNSTLDNYQVTTEGQRAALNALHKYADDMVEAGRAGRGIILFGPAGTGKDHLLAGIGRLAIQRHAVPVRWIRGTDIFSQCRAAIRGDEGDDKVVADLSKVTVLIISDPLPPMGALTEYQGDTLYRIIDNRYRELRPTWISVNVASGAEADQRMGAQVFDRLKHEALAIYCDWPSYRRPLGSRADQ
jgi:DNA replication protein DnaC